MAGKMGVLVDPGNLNDMVSYVDTIHKQREIADALCVADNKGSTDEQLMRHFIALGCQPCFCRLHAKYNKQLVQYASKFISYDMHEAQDIVQSTWLRVHLRHETMKPVGRVRPWIFSIAANLAIDTQRKRIRKFAYSLDYHYHDDFGYIYDSGDVKFMDRDLQIADESHDPVPESAHKSDMLDRIHTVMEKLPKGDRIAVELVFVQGLSYTEAAKSLGIPLGSFKTRISRALRFMRWRVNSPKSAWLEARVA